MKRRTKAGAPKNHEGVRCWKDGKRRFKSHAHAMNRAAELIMSKGWNSNEARAYACDFCGGFHLSSKPKI